MKAILLILGTFTLAAQAEVDLVTLPARDAVQLSIYNSADLTLVRERRLLTLSPGLNRLQFSWANTLIDPTSLALNPKAQADQIDVQHLRFPPRLTNLGVWNIQSGVAGQVPVEITYLTSGLSWRAFYMGTLSPDEQHMRLQGYVRVSNNSGEDYETAQTRLIVGKVNLLDQIPTLAQRKQPFGRPGTDIQVGTGFSRVRAVLTTISRWDAEVEVDDVEKKIIKEGLSEYFLYTIEGKETIPTGWSKRLPSFDRADIPVVNFYKFDEERWGAAVMRFLSFKNDAAHQLGDTPIPGGVLKVYRGTGADQHLSYTGQSSFKYIPVDEKVELNLGAARKVSVRPTLMDLRSEQFNFDRKGNVSGWHEVRRFKVEVNNTRAIPAKVQVDRNFSTPHWSLEHAGKAGTYEKLDLDTARFTLELNAGEKKTFTYTLTTRHGVRENP